MVYSMADENPQNIEYILESMNVNEFFNYMGYRSDRQKVIDYRLEQQRMINNRK